MHVRWRNRAVLVAVLVASLLAPLAQLGWEAGAQTATPAPAATPMPAATPATAATLVPGAQTWQVLVNNVSPEGENWSFNTYYPDHIQAHPGDWIRFTLASNPQAFHTVMVLAPVLTPLKSYSGVNTKTRA